MRKIKLPLTKRVRKSLKAGDELFLTGRIYTARDAAHKRLSEAILKRQTPPIELKDNIIFYCGPSPTKPGDTVGSCGFCGAWAAIKYYIVFKLYRRGLSF
jgi:fumarate hydratase subunit beta